MVQSEHTNSIICPYCGSENLDSWEEKTSEGDLEGDLGHQCCDRCDKRYIASRHVQVSYSSFKTPCLNGEKRHEWLPIIGIPKEYFKGKFRCKICGSKKEVK